MENGMKKLKRNQMGELVEDKDLPLEHWEERWDKGLTRFHVQKTHPMLEEFYEKMTEGKESQRILLPCCGKSIDMKWLSDKGHEVVGVDIADAAALQFFEEHKLEYEVQNIPDVQGKAYKSLSAANQVTIYCFDLYKMTPEVIGYFDCIWDRGSLVAINVADRFKYVETISRVMNEKTRYLLSTFLVNHDTFAGPPHQCSEKDIEALYGEKCEIEFLKKRDVFGPWQKDTWQVDYFFEEINLLRLK